MRKFRLAIAVLVLVIALSGCTQSNPPTNTDGSFQGVSVGDNQADATQESAQISSIQLDGITPIMFFTKEESIDTEGDRTWPTLSLWRKVGNEEPIMIADKIGKKGEFPASFDLTPNKQQLLINLESKLMALDLQTLQLKQLFVPKKQVANFIFTQDDKQIIVWDQNYETTDYNFFVHKVDLASGVTTQLGQGNSQQVANAYQDGDNQDGAGSLYVQGLNGDNLLLYQTLGEASAPWVFDLKKGTLQRTPNTRAELYYAYSSAGNAIAKATGVIDNICNTFAGNAPSTYNLLDPMTGKTLGTFGDGQRVADFYRFSPDGKKAWYAQFETVKDETSCDDKVERSFYEYDLATSKITQVSGNDQQVFDQWFPDKAGFDYNEIERIVMYKAQKWYEFADKESLIDVYPQSGV